MTSITYNNTFIEFSLKGFIAGISEICYSAIDGFRVNVMKHKAFFLSRYSAFITFAGKFQFLNLTSPTTRTLLTIILVVIGMVLTPLYLIIGIPFLISFLPLFVGCNITFLASIRESILSCGVLMKFSAVKRFVTCVAFPFHSIILTCHRGGGNQNR